jgi:SNF2 family DNA or RNA helicase
MPGFLGNEKQFKQFFRTPIEKNKDLEKQKMLAARVKPFMLRRLKDEVVLDLPPKTEIIRTVELSSEQKDLYESIRLSMEKKVREAINKKGLSRSHIIILDALLKLRQTCCHPQLLSLNSARKNYKHSAKFNLLMDMLPQMIEEGRKVLVFSQFTKMLSLIEQDLTERGINFVKLTGATRNREKPVNSFQSGEVPVFLISLKAGGTGLNLTAADSVIHFDPWWNPAVEDQASDRSHRIGQDKPVFVYKIITKGTIEETIQEMQQKKRALMNGLFNEQEGRGINLSADDLQSLFKPIR